MLGKATDVDVSCRRLTHDDLTMLHRWVNEFFVKQKTAYEIWRDWSSDVCSSDLAVGGREPGRRRTRAERLVVEVGAEATAGGRRVAGARHARDRGFAVGVGERRDAARRSELRSEERRVGKERRSRWSQYR